MPADNQRKLQNTNQLSFIERIVILRAVAKWCKFCSDWLIDFHFNQKVVLKALIFETTISQLRLINTDIQNVSAFEWRWIEKKTFASNSFPLSSIGPRMPADMPLKLSEICLTRISSILFVLFVRCNFQKSSHVDFDCYFTLSSILPTEKPIFLLTHGYSIRIPINRLNWQLNSSNNV